MRYCLFYIIIVLFSFACSNQAKDTPLWLNASDTLSIPTDSLLFTIRENGDYEMYLMSYTQPIQLNVSKRKGRLTAYLKNISGIIEGPAHLVIKIKNQYNLYPVWLTNSTKSVSTTTEYRSPKTVNPDSSLHQHIMYQKIDQWRNLVALQRKDVYFVEEINQLSPKAGVYLGQKENPITAYYVQPGSPKIITIKASYNKIDQDFIVVTEQLKDEYNNVIADGTNVVFTYWNENVSYKMEALTINGYVTVKIPIQKNWLSLSASIGNTTSNIIQLKAN